MHHVYIQKSEDSEAQIQDSEAQILLQDYSLSPWSEEQILSSFFWLCTERRPVGQL